MKNIKLKKGNRGFVSNNNNNSTIIIFEQEGFAMIQLIAGLQGAGKTRNLIDLANQEIKTTKGHLVYVDADSSHILQLSHDIRLIKTDDYPLVTPEEFFGFVCGVLSQDYDIVTVYIDGLLKNAKTDISKAGYLIEKVSAVSEKTGVDFIISVCCEPKDLPDSVRQYLKD